MPSLTPAGLIVAAYLIGSIPFSFIVVKLFGGDDLRQVGSRNVGATNVARHYGKLPGITALLLDLAKGYGAVALARWVVAQPLWPFEASATAGPLQSRAFWIALAGLVAVLGHMFPAWLRFHGGKGVATATGVFLALAPILLAAAAIAFLIVLMLSRYVSLASIVAAASMPLFSRLLTPDAPIWQLFMTILISLAVVGMHHSNIARIVAGTERRVGGRQDQR